MNKSNNRGAMIGKGHIMLQQTSIAIGERQLVICNKYSSSTAFSKIECLTVCNKINDQ